jgi:tRNA pseudouridine55 synthase
MNPGFLLINKPAGPTSHDIVDRIRRITATKTVGHAGTLDPFATGLLIVGVGREATREFIKLVGLDKHYIATLRLGATSDTDDRTGVITTTALSSPPSDIGGPIHIERTDDQATALDSRCALGNDKKIETVLKRFTGKIQQVPPMYSAKKSKGKKLYELAREGKTVERAPVPIEVFSIDIVNYSLLTTPYSLVLDIHCSSGTYIRALARDIGEALGCGAYLEELERTAIGPFKLEEAIKIDELNTGNWEKYLISPANMANRCQ